MRAFLAVPLPPAVCEELAAVARTVEGLRAQKPDTIHLTIRFLGDIAKPEPIVEAVRPVAEGHEPFDMELERLGTFPRRGSPRVLWVGLGVGEMQAGALAAGVDEALATLGIKREQRPWRGHVTLGRFRSRPKADPGDRSRSFGRVRAKELVLYQSALTPQGAVHQAVEEMSLGRDK